MNFIPNKDKHTEGSQYRNGLSHCLCALNFFPHDFGEATCTFPIANAKGNLLLALISAFDRKVFVHIKPKEHRPEDCSVKNKEQDASSQLLPDRHTLLKYLWSSLYCQV